MTGFDEFMERHSLEVLSPKTTKPSIHGWSVAEHLPQIADRAATGHSKVIEQHCTACPNCKASVVPGSRWCRICHSNIVNPSIGRLASPLKRLGAQILALLVSAVAFSLTGFMLLTGDPIEKNINNGRVIAALVPLIAIFVWEIFCWMQGTSIGKMLIGMRVVTENGTTAGFFTMAVRELIGKLISSSIFSLGFIWILIDPDYQAWHDKLTGTYVVE
ncbi:MAG TPA: RDD family protein [Lacipirellulaceae bacterium]